MHLSKMKTVSTLILVCICGATIGKSVRTEVEIDNDRNHREQKQFDFLSWLFGSNVHPHPRSNQTDPVKNSTHHHDQHLNSTTPPISNQSSTSESKIPNLNINDQIFSATSRNLTIVPAVAQGRGRGRDSSSGARRLGFKTSYNYNDHPISKRQAYFGMGVTQEMLLRAALLQQQQQQQQQFYGLQNYQNPLLMSQLYNALGNGVGTVTRSGTGSGTEDVGTNKGEGNTKRRRRRPQYNDDYEDDDESDEYFDSDEFASNPFGSAFGR